MIRTIAAREILDNLMSLKFLLGTLLCLTLVIIGTIVSLQNYQTRVAEYVDTVAEFDENTGIGQVRIVRKPEVLSIFARGSSEHLGDVIESLAASPMAPVSAICMAEEQMYRLTTGFASSIDLLFAIRVMVSLMAIFLAYDTISGEYERGTLKLMLSRPISKASIILGKLIAGTFCLLVPLTISFIIAILIIHLIGNIAFTFEEWFRIASIFGVSILCVMSFYMLGVVVSIKTRRSAISLLILLLIWISGIFLIPAITTAAIGRYRLMSDHPGQNIIEVRSSSMAKTRKMRGETKSPNPREDPNAWINHMSNLNTAIYKVEDEIDLTIWNMQNQYLNRLYFQAALARWICRISPSESCAYAGEAMARTDIEAFQYFMRYAYEYYKPHREDVKEYRMKYVRLFWTDRDKYKMEIAKFNKRYSKSIESPTIGIATSFRAAALDICLLYIFNILLLMMSILLFVRYEVH